MTRPVLIIAVLVLGATAALAHADATDAVRANAGSPARLVAQSLASARTCAMDGTWSCVRAEGSYMIERAERMRARLDESGMADDAAREAVAYQRRAIARLIRGAGALEAGEYTRGAVRDVTLGLRAVRAAPSRIAWIPSQG